MCRARRQIYSLWAKGAPISLRAWLPCAEPAMLGRPIRLVCPCLSLRPVSVSSRRLIPTHAATSTSSTLRFVPLSYWRLSCSLRDSGRLPDMYIRTVLTLECDRSPLSPQVHRSELRRTRAYPHGLGRLGTCPSSAWSPPFGFKTSCTYIQTIIPVLSDPALSRSSCLSPSPPLRRSYTLMELLQNRHMH